jgi:type I restriction enzyme, R subunit
VPSEADTGRKYVVPLLQAAGWDNEPYSIAEQRTITDGRIVPVGRRFIGKPPKQVDFLRLANAIVFTDDNQNP